MKNEGYKPRIIDSTVEKYLKSFGAVCIQGPKWCGKTWTSAYHAESEILIGNPEGNFQNRHLAQLSPALILSGDTPRLIDEWQDVPPIWDAVRYEVDRRNLKGQFVLTGSSTPKRKGIMHSGAGRIGTLNMHPMSLWEAGRSRGVISLKALCEKRFEPMLTGEVDIQDLIDCIIRGGWPGNQESDIENAALLPREYINTVITDDVHRIDGIRRDEKKVRLLLRSLARNESTTVSNKTLKRDIQENDSDDIDEKTLSVYFDIFTRLFLTENQKPFGISLRSSARVKQSEKRHFADPSLAAAILEATPKMLLGDLRTLGFLFEALCERDLQIYAESFGAKLFHYQDYSNREIDAVLELEDGDWAAFEIKLGANEIDAGAKNLLKIQKEIEAEKGKTAKINCVICGMSNAAYQRPDRVYVVPLTALKN